MAFRRDYVHVYLILLGCVGLSECKSIQKFKVVTYNTALLGANISSFDTTIPDNRVERRDAIIKYLNRRSNADIVCLQEVFIGQDVEEIVKGVHMKFPNSFSQVHNSDGTLPPQSDVVWAPPCSTTDYVSFVTCGLANGCLTLTSNSVLTPSTYTCFVSNCPTEFQTLIFTNSEHCVSCLIRTSPDKHFERCAGPPSKDIWNINKIGLLLLSKKPLSDLDAVEYFPNDINIFAYGYLRAKVGGLTIGCTHVVPTTFNFPPLMPQFQTFSEQHTVEIQTFVDAFINSRTVVALGDFNCGPGSEMLDPLEQSDYEILISSFFTTKLTKKGTFTSDNPYNVVPGQSYNYAIDHVLCAGSASILNTKIILKNNPSLDESRWLPLSDHYGVQAIVRVEN